MAAELSAQHLFSVRGYVAVVTGAGSGIGYMISRGLVANGAKVYLADRNSVQTQVEALNKLGQQTGGTAFGVHCDVSDKTSVQQLVQHIREREQHVDILVSNAGIRRDPPEACNVLQASLAELQSSLWSSPDTDWVDTFKTNTTAHYYLSVAFMPLLEAASRRDLGDGRAGKDEGRGVVVVMSSCASMHNATNIDLTSYATSKAATDHLVRLLAAKFNRFYIRVNGVNPGFVPTNMNKVGEADNIFKDLFDKVPAKRAGNEGDIVGAVLFLASRAGAYVHGVSLCVDGGRVLVANGQE